ncbi:hypothetical protein PI85_05985 [Lysinibacillus sp. A1]|jgi:hypothetical protein|uniref:hypothetical protein n=1 Tax=Lysinibacillus fusiformis TaxID=28031 RepID=UPI0004D70061|nr:hypothetical protein HR49_22375 [Lysinibacillus fusiformis]KHK54346.1 hypothetical protein PI85_05985 [Lysinibacillus sp. A1]
MKIKTKQENCNGIPYDFFDQNSNSICFMLSGTGYSYEKPVLYYSRLSIQFCESLFIQLKAYIQKNEPSISM